MCVVEKLVENGSWGDPHAIGGDTTLPLFEGR
jgi:hypothetical protein